MATVASGPVTTASGAPVAVTAPVQSNSIKQVCRTTITNLLSQYFANTLGKETDIVNLVMAMIQYESHFDVTARGPSLNTLTSSGARDYYNSNAVQNILVKGIFQQKTNLQQGLNAWGLMQTMGWNQVKGASLATGKCLIESARPDLVGILCVNPGESLQTMYSGSSTIQNQILAGLAVLESKYKSVKQSGNQYSIGPFTYNSKMECSIQGYIGLSLTDKGNGSSTAAYVSSICYGAAYTLANGSSGITAPNGSTKGTGAITVASGDNQHPPGC